MLKRKPRPANTEPIPDVVQDEAIIVPQGDTEYRLWLDDASVELMAQGILPEAVARRCHGMLEWKRRYARVCARELNEAGPLFAPEEIASR